MFAAALLTAVLAAEPEVEATAQMLSAETPVAETPVAETSAEMPSWPPKPTAVDKLLGSDRLLRRAAMAAGPDANPYPVDSDEWIEGDPLLVIDSEMGQVVRDFSGGDLTRPHTTTQPRIIARLDRMIMLLEKKKSGVGGGNGGSPAGDSGIRKGQMKDGELNAEDTSDSGMQKLPDDQREKIRQADADGFPPGFDDVLSDYYKRLAEAE